MASAVETPDATYSAKRFRRADSTMPGLCAAAKRWEAMGLAVEDALQDCVQVASVSKVAEAWKVTL